MAQVFGTYKVFCGHCKKELKDYKEIPGVWDRNPHCPECKAFFDGLGDRFMIVFEDGKYSASKVEPNTNCWYYEMGELKYACGVWAIVCSGNESDFKECFRMLKERVVQDKENAYLDAMRNFATAKLSTDWDVKGRDMVIYGDKGDDEYYD